MSKRREADITPEISLFTITSAGIFRKCQGFQHQYNPA